MWKIVSAHHGQGSAGEHEVSHPQCEAFADAARRVVRSILIHRQLLGLPEGRRPYFAMEPTDKCSIFLTQQRWRPFAYRMTATKLHMLRHLHERDGYCVAKQHLNCGRRHRSQVEWAELPHLRQTQVSSLTRSELYAALPRSDLLEHGFGPHHRHFQSDCRYMLRTRGSTTARSQTASSLQPGTEVTLTRVAPLACICGCNM